MIILSDLEPYRHLTKAEVNDLLAKGLITKAEAIPENDFTGFVRRFERENDNILEFGTAIAYDKKIKAIKDTLLGYAEEQIPRDTQTKI